MTRRLTVLIVGGYGTFGGRLAKLLAGEARLTLLIAGRSSEKASRFCASLTAAAGLVPTVFDRDGDIIQQLAALTPDIVVDATGPFQAYGDDPYRLVRASVAAGINYLDLADGSDFVAGIDHLDAAARSRGIYALSGVSSFPVLTAAVVRHLGQHFGRVDTIAGGIAPSPYAGVGLNVIRAIAGYAGQPTQIWRDGAWTQAYPLTETRRYTIAPPGCLPLRNTLFSLVEVPDLSLLPAVSPDARSVWMGAGPVPEILHRALIGLAWLVRWRTLPSLTACAPLFLGAINRIRWGEHRGGMFVEMNGADAAGRSMTASWHMLAEGEDGPLIPSMAVEAIIRAQLEGVVPEAGSRPALRVLELADYDRVFARRRITTGLRRTVENGTPLPLYRRVLDEAWDRLPAAVRAMHTIEDTATAAGRATVERGSNPMAQLMATLVRLPSAAPDIPVAVRIERKGDGEVWRRRFGRHAFRSHHSTKAGRWQNLLIERFGLLAFGLALVVDDQRLHFVVRRWALMGVPLPLWLAPVSHASEAEVDGRFAFDIDIRHRMIGRIVRYRGWLAAPDANTLAAADGVKESAFP